MAAATPSNLFKGSVLVASLLALAFLSKWLLPTYYHDGTAAAGLVLLIALAFVSFVAFFGFLFLQIAEETERAEKVRRQQIHHKRQ